MSENPEKNPEISILKENPKTFPTSSKNPEISGYNPGLGNTDKDNYYIASVTSGEMQPWDWLRRLFSGTLLSVIGRNIPVMDRRSITR